MDEVDRIADTTQFNGKGLLDGSASRTVMTNTLSIHAISASMDVPRNDYEITIDAMPEAAKAQLGYDIDKKKIQMKDPIKAVGTTSVAIKLHPKVTAELKVVVEGI